MDAVLEEDRITRGPIPPPISEEHAAMRERIEHALGAMYEKVAQALEGKDLDEAVREDPDLALHEAVGENPEIGNDAAIYIMMAREEAAFLASQGVDPRPYFRHEPRSQILGPHS
jgi:hypothetical protein